MCKDCHHQEHAHTPNDHHECQCGCCSCKHEEEERPLWRVVLPIITSALLLLWGTVANPLSGGWQWVVFLLAYLPIGLPIIKEAGEEMAEGEIFNEFTLMLLATIGAFAIGEYPEAVAVLLFYSVGEYFQDRAVDRAKSDIQALINLRPDTATVIASNGTKETKAPEEVLKNEIIEVVAGGRVPLDGTLLNVRAFFDTAALTGEAEPRSIERGAEVSAGMIATGQVVQLRVLRPYAESALQRILDMVKDAASHKSKAEVFIRRFARVYTPIVIVLAALVALLPPLLIGGTWSEWLYRALAFLVISCPCALVVSIPLAYFRGIGVASRKGILFKGGNYLDAVTHLTEVVFDKTGTLTTGHFAIDHIDAVNGEAENSLLRIVASVERYSTHPIARAIVEHGQALGFAPTCNVEEIAGLGLKAQVEEKCVWVGKRLLLSKNNIHVPERFAEDEVFTYVYCAIDEQFVGTIALADQPRADAAQGIKKLHSLRVSTAMLSGDRTAVVAHLAQRLGIDSYHGDLLPEGKVEAFKQIKEAHTAKNGGKVAFVGDGINDAPVLALSDVGFAMGEAGSDAAVETADVVIQSDSPSLVAEAIDIGRLTHRLVVWNIALALSIKVGVMLASALGFASLWAAVLADTGVALLCVANTYAIRAKKGR